MRPAPPSQARWWGWGGEQDRPRLGGTAAAMLAEGLGLGERPPRPVALGQLRLPPPDVPEQALRALRAAVGAAHVLDDVEARVRHAAGKSYLDLVRLRTGEIAGAPDVVVRPGSAVEVADVLAACAAAGIAVVPFGGGTSVVGGVEPVRDGHAALISLDLGRMDRLISLDERSLLAVFEPGVTAPRAEELLAARGLTLGHFPQSFEYATIGGFVATRSAGQASTGYGRIDDLVEGLRLAAPAGEVVAPAVPASAAGPSLRELLVGSEGTLGVICEATLRVRPRPEQRRYEGFRLGSFAAGVEALRQLAQAGAAPDVARLSDEAETALAAAAGGEGGGTGGGSLGTRVAQRLRRGRGGEQGGCLLVCGWEGERRSVARRRAGALRVLRAAGARALGPEPGERWRATRYDGPYLRDDLLDLGALVETLETAAPWSRVEALHASVSAALRAALEARGTPPLVGCHVSHVYRSGASLYFTVIARGERGGEAAQWGEAKAAAMEAVLAGGGTITHHHAVGREHREWLRREAGDAGVEALRAVKTRLDPAGIMNPGKLLP